MHLFKMYSLPLRHYNERIETQEQILELIREVKQELFHERYE